MKKNNYRKKFKDKKISSKLSIIMSIIVTVSLCLLISISYYGQKTSLESALNNRFFETSEKNANITQNMLHKVFAALSDLQDYLNFSYPEYIEKVKSINDTENSIGFHKSLIFNNIDINNISYQLELTYIQSMCHFIQSNDEIISIGIYFNKDAFNTKIPNYSVCTSREMCKTNKCFPYEGNYLDEEWYKTTVHNNKVSLTSPRTKNNSKIITATYPIIYKGKAIGMIGADILLTKFSKVKVEDEEYPTLNTILTDKNDIIIYDNFDTSNIGSSVSKYYSKEQFETLNNLKNKNEPFSIDLTAFNNKVYKAYFHPVKFGNITWWNETSLEERDYNKSIIKLFIYLLVVSSFVLIVILYLITYLINRLLKPLENLNLIADNISNGNFNHNFKVTKEDEVGKLMHSFEYMTNSIKNIIQELILLFESISRGDWTTDISVEDFKGEWKPLAESLQLTTQKVCETLSQVNQVAAQISSGAEQVSNASLGLSQGSTIQASSVEKLSSTIYNISNDIKKASEYTYNSKEITKNANTALRDGNEKMSQMTLAMDEITNSASKISEIIKTIDSIAFQTNILALNAAIEAARAGSAGQGFAVVADEVRNLAQKSAVAAKNTAELIKNTIDSINKGTTLIEDTAVSIDIAYKSFEKVDECVDTIAQISKQQVENISIITEEIDQVSNIVQSNSATSEETAASSEELNSQAYLLKELVEEFKIK